MNVSDLTVAEFTSPTVVTVRPDDSLDTALELMQENRIRHLPVMVGEKIVGVISERNVLANIGKDWTRLVRVNDIMSTSILSVYMNDNLGQVAYELSSQKKGSALVLDFSGNLYGIFTTTDALNALVEILYPNAQEKSDIRINN
jgi:acetoin utilization protein AcuB